MIRGKCKDIALPLVASLAAAYCCYTSGSTGKPKGVVVDHINAMSQIYWFDSTNRLTLDGTLLGVTELTHDPAVIELFWPLMCGARHFVASADERRDGLILKRLMIDERIDAIQAVPFIFYNRATRVGRATAGSLSSAVESPSPLLCRDTSRAVIRSQTSTDPQKRRSGLRLTCLASGSGGSRRARFR